MINGLVLDAEEKSYCIASAKLTSIFAEVLDLDLKLPHYNAWLFDSRARYRSSDTPVLSCMP